MFNLKTISKGLVALTLMAASALAYAAPVNVNTADAAALAANIHGVGPKKAQAIIRYRESNGPFQSVEELERVKGIGFKTLEQNADVLLISENAEASAKTAKK